MHKEKKHEDLFVEFLVCVARSLAGQQQLGVNVLMVPEINQIINC